MEVASSSQASARPPRERFDQGVLNLGLFPDEGGRIVQEESSTNAPGVKKHLPGSPEEQCLLLATHGVSGVLRFMNFGTRQVPEIKGLPDMTQEDLERVAVATNDYGVSWHCWGSPIGKGVKVVDVQDESGRPYSEPGPYAEKVEGWIKKVQFLKSQVGGFQLVRVFSGNFPLGSNSSAHIDDAAKLLGPTFRYLCDQGFIVGDEIETGHVGDLAENLVKLHQAVGGLSHVGSVYDFGNISSQGDDIVAAWEALEKEMVMIHIKNYIGPCPAAHGPIDEHALIHYAPLNVGDCGQLSAIHAVLTQLKNGLPAMMQRLEGLGLDGVPTDFEGHIAGGGPKGGISTPLGVRVKIEGARKMFADHNIPFRQEGWRELQFRRGF